MALDWKYFTLRPGIKNLPLNEQMRLFKIANEKSINHRKRLAESFTDMSTSTLKSGRAGGPSPSKYKFTNPYCFEFDGVDDSIQFAGDPAIMNLNGDISISAWITLDADIFNVEAGQKDYHIVDKFVFAGSNPTGYNLYIRRSGTGGAINTVKIRSAFGVSGNNVFACTNQINIHTGTFKLEPNTPYNIVSTFEFNGGFKNSGQMKIYIDGVLAATKDMASPGTFVPASSEKFVIGNSVLSLGQGKEYHGKIDEVSIWNTLLDASDVAALYNWNANGNLNKYSKSANLQGWYRMGENAEFDEVSGNWTLKSATDPDDDSLKLTSTGMVFGDRKEPGLARDKS